MDVKERTEELAREANSVIEDYDIDEDSSPWGLADLLAEMMFRFEREFPYLIDEAREFANNTFYKSRCVVAEEEDWADTSELVPGFEGEPDEEFEQELCIQYITASELHKMCEYYLELYDLLKAREPLIDFWHITSLESAESIIKNGFEARPTPRGPGISISIYPPAAKALLKTTQKMFSFDSYEEVIDYYAAHKVPLDKLEHTFERFLADKRREWKHTPAGLYLEFMTFFHSSVGGPASIPRNQFLWSDIGNNLLKQGSPIVAVAGLYEHRPTIDGDLPQFTRDSIEAELFIKNVGRLIPLYIIRRPEFIV